MHPHKSPRVGRHVTALFGVAVGDTMCVRYRRIVHSVDEGLRRDKFTVLDRYCFHSGGFAVLAYVLAESHLLVLMEQDEHGYVTVLVDLYTCRSRRDGKATLKAFTDEFCKPLTWSDQPVTVDENIAPKRDLCREGKLLKANGPLIRATLYGLHDAAILDGSRIRTEATTLLQSTGYVLPFAPLLVPFYNEERHVGYTLLAIGRKPDQAQSAVAMAIHTYIEYGSKCIVSCGQGDSCTADILAMHNLLVELLQPTRVQFAEGKIGRVDRKQPLPIAA